MIKAFFNGILRRRAIAVSVGSAIAVAPFFIVRVLAALALDAAGGFGSGWFKIAYIPFELLVPMMLGLRYLGNRPDMEPLGFSLRTIGWSTVLAPFVTVFIGTLIYLIQYASLGVGGSAMTLLGLVPSLGALGLIGVVMALLPLLVTGWGIGILLDNRLYNRHRSELQKLQLDEEAADRKWNRQKGKFRDLWRRFFLRLGSGKGSREYQLLNFNLQMQRFHLPVLEKLENLRSQASESGSQRDLWRRVFDQAGSAERHYRDLLGVLLEKFDPREITFGRYQASAWQVFLTIMDNLHEAGRQIYAARTSSLVDESLLAKAQFKLQHNDDALQALASAHGALARLETGTSREAVVSQSDAVRDLEDMAQRARSYSD